MTCETVASGTDQKCSLPRERVLQFGEVNSRREKGGEEGKKKKSAHTVATPYNNNNNNNI